MLNVFLRNIDMYLSLIISENHSQRRLRTCPSCTVNIVAADDLAMEEARRHATNRLNLKFDQILECSVLEYAQPITTKFCTRHDSYTVVTCAKNLVVIGWICDEQEHYELLLNFEFDRGIVSGICARRWYWPSLHGISIPQTPVNGSCYLPLGALQSMWAIWCKI